MEPLELRHVGFQLGFGDLLARPNLLRRDRADKTDGPLILPELLRKIFLNPQVYPPCLRVLTQNRLLCLDLEEDHFWCDKYFDLVGVESFLEVERTCGVRIVRKDPSTYFEGVLGRIWLELLVEDETAANHNLGGGFRRDEDWNRGSSDARDMIPVRDAATGGDHDVAASRTGTSTTSSSTRPHPEDYELAVKMREAVQVLGGGAAPPTTTTPSASEIAKIVGSNKHKCGRMLKKYEDFIFASATLFGENDHPFARSCSANDHNNILGIVPAKHDPPAHEDHDPAGGGPTSRRTTTKPVYWADVINLYGHLRACSTGARVELTALYDCGTCVNDEDSRAYTRIGNVWQRTGDSGEMLDYYEK